MQICRAVVVGPKQVLTITLKYLLVEILDYLEISRLRLLKKRKIQLVLHWHRQAEESSVNNRCQLSIKELNLL